MEREFLVRGTRRVLYETTERIDWYVTASSFEEAQRKVERSQWDWHDIVEVLDEEFYDNVADPDDIEDIECRECGEPDTYCECGENPNDEGVTPEYLEEGRWYMPDSWTRRHTVLDVSALRVEDVSGPDCDDDYRIEYVDSTGQEGRFWAPSQSRFLEVDEPEGFLERAEEREKAAEEKSEAMKADEAVRLLLSPTL